MKWTFWKVATKKKKVATKKNLEGGPPSRAECELDIDLQRRVREIVDVMVPHMVEGAVGQLRQELLHRALPHAEDMRRSYRAELAPVLERMLQLDAADHLLMQIMHHAGRELGLTLHFDEEGSFVGVKQKDETNNA